MPNLERPWKVPGYPYLPIISGVACIVLIFTVNITSIYIGLILLGAGVLIYFVWVYLFNHSAVLEREGIIERREEVLKRRELEVLLMKSRVARKMAEDLLRSKTMDVDQVSEEKLNFIQRLKDFEAIETKNLSSVEEIEEAKDQINQRLEKITLILRLEELERLEQRSRLDIESSKVEPEKDVGLEIDEKDAKLKKMALFDILKKIIRKEQKKITKLTDLGEDIFSLKSEELLKKMREIEDLEASLAEEINQMAEESESEQKTEEKTEEKSDSNWEADKKGFLSIFKSKNKKTLQKYEADYADELQVASYIDLDSFKPSSSEKDDLMRKLKEIEREEKQVKEQIQDIKKQSSKGNRKKDKKNKKKA